MHRDGIRRSLAWGLAATLLLPIVLAVVLGLGGLLGGLGDSVGAAVCSRVALVFGGLWLTAIAATTAMNAAAAIQHGGRGHRPCRSRHDRDSIRGRRGRRTWRRGRRRLRDDDRKLPGIGDALPDRPS